MVGRLPSIDLFNLFIFFASVPTLAKYAKKQQEKIDEIQIKPERTQNRDAFSQFIVVSGHGVHVFQLLRVIGNKRQKDRDDRISNYPHHRRAFEENIDKA